VDWPPLSFFSLLVAQSPFVPQQSNLAIASRGFFRMELLYLLLSERRFRRCEAKESDSGGGGASEPSELYFSINCSSCFLVVMRLPDYKHRPLGRLGIVERWGVQSFGACLS
jgi:hypothetical protein